VRAAASRPELVLASSSPRRRELLAGLGLVFRVRPVDLDETPRPGEAAEAYVLRLARQKAAARGEPAEVVLAADTVVTLDGELLGKPENPREARRMLARLAGREHRVLTGVALWEPEGESSRAPSQGRRVWGVETTAVRMASLTGEEIDWYVATGEPLDKAGSYAVQGLGGLFVDAVHGNYTNVVGLPLPLTYRLFADLGWDLKDWRRP
jgi:septum formation protein